MKHLSVHLTDLCNSKCSFCVVASPMYVSDSVDYQGIVRFLEAHSSQGYEAVNLHGGEPTISPRFFDTLALIKRLGYREIHLQTNGIRLANEDFAARTVDAGVTLLIVSLHAADPAVQDKLTHSPGGFEKTLRGIRNVVKLGAGVRTNTVITKQNSRQLERIARLACDLGVSHVNISNFHPVGSSMFSLQQTLPALKDVADDVRAAANLVLAERRRLTLEGFPFCILPELVTYQLNLERRQVRMLMRGEVIPDYDLFMSNHMRVLGDACHDCGWKDDCGGVYPEYVQIYGWSEMVPPPRARSERPTQAAE